MDACVYVIIPIYNVEKYLKNCIESVLRQKYQNIKIILVNDGSTDLSGEIIEGYRARKNVRIIHKINGGLSSARNAGLDLAFGEINENDVILFLDSDDAMSETYIQSMLEVMDDDITLALGDVQSVSVSGELLQRNKKDDITCSGIEYLAMQEGDYFSFAWGGA